MALDKPQYVLFDKNNVSYDVYNLKAFCKEHGLNVQAMRDVVRGRNKQHRGWHQDKEEEAKLEKRLAELDRMFPETGDGNFFIKLIFPKAK